MTLQDETVPPAAQRKVLILSSHSDSASLRRIKRQINELIAKEYQISVICPTQDAEDDVVDFPGGVFVYRYPALGSEIILATGWMLLCQFMLSLWVLIGEGFDAVHAVNPPDSLFVVGAFYKFLFETRLLLDLRILRPELYESRHKGRGLAYWIFVGIEKMALATADVVLVPNQSYRKVAVARGGIDNGKVFTVGDSPDLEKSAMGMPSITLRSGKKYLVGCSSLMERQDGVPYLIEAVRHIVHDLKRTDIQFALTGTEKALKDFQEIAEQKQVDAYVTVAEPKALSGVDICVCPNEVNSINDKSTLRQIADYMALGKPIVQFDCTEGRFTAGNASLYAAANDSVDFASKIVELVDDPQKRASMGALGRTRVERVLAWSQEAPRFRAAYEALFPEGQDCCAHFLL